MTLIKLRDEYGGNERVIRYLNSQINAKRLSAKKVMAKIHVAGSEDRIPKIQEKEVLDIDLHEALRVCQARLYNAIWSNNQKTRNSKDLIDEVVRYLKVVVRQIEKEEEEKSEAH